MVYNFARLKASFVMFITMKAHVKKSAKGAKYLTYYKIKNPWPPALFFDGRTFLLYPLKIARCSSASAFWILSVRFSLQFRNQTKNSSTSFSLSEYEAIEKLNKIGRNSMRNRVLIERWLKRMRQAWSVQLFHTFISKKLFDRNFFLCLSDAGGTWLLWQYFKPDIFQQNFKKSGCISISCVLTPQNKTKGEFCVQAH